VGEWFNLVESLTTVCIERRAFLARVGVGPDHGR
jgi:hypothetical protein